SGARGFREREPFVYIDWLGLLANEKIGRLGAVGDTLYKQSPSVSTSSITDRCLHPHNRRGGRSCGDTHAPWNKGGQRTRFGLKRNPRLQAEIQGAQLILKLRDQQVDGVGFGIESCSGIRQRGKLAGEIKLAHGRQPSLYSTPSGATLTRQPPSRRVGQDYYHLPIVSSRSK